MIYTSLSAANFDSCLQSSLLSSVCLNFSASISHFSLLFLIFIVLFLLYRSVLFSFIRLSRFSFLALCPSPRMDPNFPALKVYIHRAFLQFRKNENYNSFSLFYSLKSLCYSFSFQFSALENHVRSGGCLSTHLAKQGEKTETE